MTYRIAGAFDPRLLVAACALATGSVGPTADAGPAAPGAAPMLLDKMPAGAFGEMSDPTKSIFSPTLAWPSRVVTVAFNGGDPRAWPLIEAAAAEWTSHGGRLRLSFRLTDGSYRTWSENDLHAQADVRIGFVTEAGRNGYWSAIGTLAQKANANEETMNLGDLGTRLAANYGGADHAGWLASYSHSVVLHEFGHALGFSHEHFHPQCQPDLKIDQTVAWLMGPPNNWPRENAMFNMDAKTYWNVMFAQYGKFPVVTSPAIDQASVMLYSYAASFYKSGIKSPCRPSGPLHYATGLSAGDRAYYARNYAEPRHASKG